MNLHGTDQRASWKNGCSTLNKNACEAFALNAHNIRRKSESSYNFILVIVIISGFSVSGRVSCHVHHS